LPGPDAMFGRHNQARLGDTDGRAASDDLDNSRIGFRKTMSSTRQQNGDRQYQSFHVNVPK
jgi:hypothetical protein